MGGGFSIAQPHLQLDGTVMTYYTGETRYLVPQKSDQLTLPYECLHPAAVHVERLNLR